MASVDAMGSLLGGLLADAVGSRLALAIWASAPVISIYPIVYTLLAGNPWAMLLWDFAVVGPVGIFQLYIYDNDPPEGEGYSSWARL